MVDVVQLGGVPDDVQDPIPVAAVVVRVPGIDQDRLTDRRHEQRGGTPLDVDEVNVQPLILLPRNRSNINRHDTQQADTENKPSKLNGHQSSLVVRNKLQSLSSFPSFSPVPNALYCVDRRKRR